MIEKGIKIEKISNYYESLSWPDIKKPKYLNIILKSSTNFPPDKLLKIFKSIEKKLGRKNNKKNSPRECDIDIIDFNSLIQKEKLNLPHKMMHLRNFVLIPLFEIEKSWVHPIKRINIKKLIYTLSNEDISSIKKI